MGGQVTEGAACQPIGSRSVLPHVTLLLTGNPVRDSATQHMHCPEREPSAAIFSAHCAENTGCRHTRKTPAWVQPRTHLSKSMSRALYGSLGSLSSSSLGRAF